MYVTIIRKLAKILLAGKLIKHNICHWRKKMKKGFTLAEVLITLGIIGVVAAMTLPALIQKQNDIATVSKIKKYYSILSQSELIWEQDLGCIGNIPLCLESFNSFDSTAFDAIEKSLKITYKVYKNQNTSNKSWLSDTTMKMDNSGAHAHAGVNKRSTNYFMQALLADGSSIAMTVENYKQCVNIWIDVNGPKKPNRVGIDVFPMAFGASYNDKYKGVNPYFCEDSSPSDDGGICSTRNGNLCSPDDGRSPTAYVLTHNKLFNLKDLGY